MPCPNSSPQKLSDELLKQAVSTPSYLYFVHRQLEHCNGRQYQECHDELGSFHTSRESSLREPRVKSSLPVSSEKALPLLTCSEKFGLNMYRSGMALSLRRTLPSACTTDRLATVVEMVTTSFATRIRSIGVSYLRMATMEYRLVNCLLSFRTNMRIVVATHLTAIQVFAAGGGDGAVGAAK